MILNIKLCVTRFEYEEAKMGPNFGWWMNFAQIGCGSSSLKFMIIEMRKFECGAEENEKKVARKVDFMFSATLLIPTKNNFRIIHYGFSFSWVKSYSNTILEAYISQISSLFINNNTVCYPTLKPFAGQHTNTWDIQQNDYLKCLFCGCSKYKSSKLLGFFYTGKCYGITLGYI